MNKTKNILVNLGQFEDDPLPPPKKHENLKILEGENAKKKCQENRKNAIKRAKK